MLALKYTNIINYLITNTYIFDIIFKQGMMNLKKVLTYLLIIIVGAAGVYYALDKFNKQETKTTEAPKKKTIAKREVIPSKDSFVEEAIKLQTLAENNNGNDICKCYNVKDLDPNTSLKGSILVYTVGDLFVSNMWLSNGYYLLDNSENVSIGVLEESSADASIYCGESSANIQSSLCDTSTY